jgi:diacylglycerol O-acyltransferase / wax synthase
LVVLPLAAELPLTDQVLSDQDAIMWREGVDRTIMTIVTNIAFFDRAPDRLRFFEILTIAVQQTPRLRSVIRPPRWGEILPRWEADPAFALSNHLHWAVCPDNGSERGLLDLAARIAAHAFSPELPWWSVTLVEGLAGGRAAVIIKRHHAILDGLGLAKLLARVVDSSKPDESPRTPDVGEEATPRSEAIAKVAKSSASPEDPSRFDQVTTIAANLYRSARLLAPAPKYLSSVMQTRSRARQFAMVTYPLEPLKNVARATGSKLNDVFIAAVAGSIQEYQASHNGVDNRVRLSLPVAAPADLRSESAGNQYSLVRIVVPLHIRRPRDRISCCRDLVQDARRRLPSGPGAALGSVILSRLPSQFSAAVFGGVLKGVDVSTTNVICSKKRLKLTDIDIERYFTFAETCGAAFAVALYSYAENANFGITIDTSAVLDPDNLISLFEKSLEEISQA